MTDTPSRLQLGAQLALAVWQPATEWQREDVARMAQVIRRVGAALGVMDEAADDPWSDDSATYQWAVISRALDAAAARLVGVAPDVWPGYAERSGLRGHPAEMVPRVDVNTATEAALDALPGLGPSSARRLVGHRAAHGPLHDLTEIRAAARISTKALETLAPFIRIADDPDRLAPPLQRAVRAEGVRALLDAIALDRMPLDAFAEEAPKGRMLELLERLAETVVASRIVPRFWVPSPTHLARGADALDTRRTMLAKASRPAQVSPVSSRAYRPLLHALIGAAQRRIWVQMFFFSVEDADSPGQKIVDALAAALARGVDVRVILDDDLPGDYHGARTVNATAFAALERVGLPLRRALPDRTAHGKAVLIDDQVLIGSHNWTASSFYRYEETSLHLISPDLASDLAAQHTAHWDALASSPIERRVHLRTLEQLSRDQIDEATELGLRFGDQWIDRARRAASRREMAVSLQMSEHDVERVRDTLRVMIELRVSELTALALLAADLDTPAKIKRASRTDIANALVDLSVLASPFNLRRIPVGMVDYLWTAD